MCSRDGDALLDSCEFRRGASHNASLLCGCQKAMLARTNRELIVHRGIVDAWILLPGWRAGSDSPE